MNLRSLYQWAIEVRSTDGVHTAMPERHVIETRRTYQATLVASSRRAAQAEAYPPIRRAMDVLIVVEACDRTGYLLRLLSASDETAQAEWDALPVALLCLECRIRRYGSQLRTRRCPRCHSQLLSYPELVQEDEHTASDMLTSGGVRVA